MQRFLQADPDRHLRIFLVSEPILPTDWESPTMATLARVASLACMVPASAGRSRRLPEAHPPLTVKSGSPSRELRMPLYIGAVAQRTGLARSTLRYYERIGLLAPSARTPAGYRVFGEQTLVELAFVRRAQALGFTLDEVREFLRLHRRGDSPCERLVATARRRLAAVERELEHLSTFATSLRIRSPAGRRAGPAAPSRGPAR